MVRKICAGKLFLLVVRAEVEDHFWKKFVGCSRHNFDQNMGKTFSRCSRKSVRGSHRPLAAFAGRRLLGQAQGSRQSVFRIVPQGQYEENVTFEKVTKLPSLVSARNCNFFSILGSMRESENSDSARFWPYRRPVGQRTTMLRSLFNEFSRLWARFHWFLYVFHESMNLWAYICTKMAIKMENILFHF